MKLKKKKKKAKKSPGALLKDYVSYLGVKKKGELVSLSISSGSGNSG